MEPNEIKKVILVNGIQYVAVQMPVLTTKAEKEIKENALKYDCIFAGVEVKTGNHKPFGIIKLLVPETNALQFSKEAFKETQPAKRKIVNPINEFIMLLGCFITNKK